MRNKFVNFSAIRGATLLLLLFAFSGSFAQLIPISLDQRVTNSTTIFEGKVLSSKSYWDDKRANIYTSNIVEVYKVFKGNLTAATVEVITEGGTVGTEKQSVTHTLELENGYVGVFMANNYTVKPLQNPTLKSYRTYSDSQGFINYNLSEMSASDVFTTYENINPYLYSEIKKRTKQDFKEIKKVDFTKTK